MADIADRLDAEDLAGLIARAERLGIERGRWAWRLGNARVGRDSGGGYWLRDHGRSTRGWVQGTEEEALRWLLRQPEAVAREAAYARGRADVEREIALGAHAAAAGAART